MTDRSRSLDLLIPRSPISVTPLHKHCTARGSSWGLPSMSVRLLDPPWGKVAKSLVRLAVERDNGGRIAVEMKKAPREMQTLRAGCSKADPKIFDPPQIPFPGKQEGQNLISWRWSLPSRTDQV